ncbi:MAG: endoribonuclease L-PSP [Tannerellaceae bacterium]|jgi:hypothetical protein|nr:endoribonuclease L-PSP [Tannerellaceae bacterium]
MNYCEKIQYRIYKTEREAFPVMIDRLLAQTPKEEAVLRLAFFGTPATNEEYLHRRSILWEKAGAYYGEQEPALSYVSQPPLNTPLILEVHSYLPEAGDRVHHRRLDGYPYVVLENGCGRFLFAGGFQNDLLHHTVEQQSVEVFRLIEKLLRLEDFPIHSIIRQWNYIEQITGHQQGQQNYQSFNNARSDFYGQTKWPNGFPAATGIGTNLGGVLVDLDAAVFTSPEAFARPIDNRLQVAAHAYSEKVLEVSGKKKTTPKFERAKCMGFGERQFIYVSGTAAIRGEESLKGVGLERQLHTTMENIAQLTGKARLSMLRIYLKNKDDYEESQRLMQAYHLPIPISYMCADVCREELLIEIEGIAIL